MKRHAYLLVAHDNPEQLRQLLSLLDDAGNDVYLQLDATAHLALDRLVLDRSLLVLLPPMAIHWGGYSLIQAELELLRRAVAHGYHYYHLLSGADLPLVSQARIHAFLEHSEAEYIDFAPEYQAFAHYKAAYRHILLETAAYRHNRIFHALRHGFAWLQARAGLDRTRGTGEVFQHGSAFFSITDALARFVLEQEPWIARTFRHGLACDEVFLQTLVMKSAFRARLPDPHAGLSGNLRHIDWRRREGNSPRTFRMGDLEELTRAADRAFFARKFDRRVDSAIVDAMIARLQRPH